MLLALFLSSGCERTIEERCASAEVRACCLLSSAEAEAVLGASVGAPRAARGDGYSSCEYRVEDGRFAELLVFDSEPGATVEAARLRQRLERGRLRQVRPMPIPNFTGAEGFWVEDLPFPDSRAPAFWVAAGPDFFRVAATPLGDGWPDWKRPRDLARSVLRNLESASRSANSR